ncbi:hypothetical protein KBC04_00950 [Candidatus Babeliales bacterium]|nr:hypothetical protein [Candidatus Babeliales bacterium]MBP9843697.1 hypothetical protein [Candidatus Babeliales bacterium]
MNKQLVLLVACLINFYQMFSSGGPSNIPNRSLNASFVRVVNDSNLNIIRAKDMSEKEKELLKKSKKCRRSFLPSHENLKLAQRLGLIDRRESVITFVVAFRLHYTSKP